MPSEASMIRSTAANASPSLTPSVRRRRREDIEAFIGTSGRVVEFRARFLSRTREVPREGSPEWVGVRLVGLWILLVAVYATTLGIPARTGMDYAGNEPHHLLAAESLVSDRDVNLTDEYAEHSYAAWYPRELRTDGREVAG